MYYREWNDPRGLVFVIAGNHQEFLDAVCREMVPESSMYIANVGDLLGYKQNHKIKFICLGTWFENSPFSLRAKMYGLSADITFLTAREAVSLDVATALAALGK